MLAKYWSDSLVSKVDRRHAEPGNWRHDSMCQNTILGAMYYLRHMSSEGLSDSVEVVDPRKVVREGQWAAGIQSPWAGGKAKRYGINLTLNSGS